MVDDKNGKFTSSMHFLHFHLRTTDMRGKYVHVNTEKTLKRECG